MDTVFDAFMATAKAAPDSSFLCAPPSPGRAYHPDGVEYTYAQVRAEALALRERYAAAGYGHGHRVGLLFENRPEFFFHYLALNALGAGVVPINPDYRHDELLYQMDHSGAELAVTIPARVAALEAVARERAKPLPVVDAEALPAALPRAGPAPREGAPGLDTECALLYTSGTTGRPKGCILTNLYYLNAGAWYRDLGGRARHRARARALHESAAALPHELHGGDGDVRHPHGQLPHPARALQPAPLVARGGRLTRDHHPLPGRDAPAPPQPGARARGARGIASSSVSAPASSPSSTSPSRSASAFPLVEVWGMTETGRIFADRFEPREIHTRAFGRPHGGLEARVVDEQDRELPADTQGELVVRWGGPEGARHGFFAGYLKNAEATEEAWRGGWFHTGDAVRRDASGMLYFVDRKKNIIRRSGENIAAAEVEACLQAHEAVAQVAVLAVPDEIREEEVMACVVAMPGSVADARLADELADWCLGRLAYFKAPGWVLFVDRLPTTGTQKVQKTQIFPPGEDPRRRPGCHRPPRAEEARLTSSA